MVYKYPGKTRGQASVLMLEALKNEGMSPLEVIRAATVNAAELLGWQDRIGSLVAQRFRRGNDPVLEPLVCCECGDKTNITKGSTACPS